MNRVALTAQTVVIFFLSGSWGSKGACTTAIYIYVSVILACAQS